MFNIAEDKKAIKDYKNENLDRIRVDGSNILKPCLYKKR